MCTPLHILKRGKRRRGEVMAICTGWPTLVDETDSSFAAAPPPSSLTVAR